MLELVPPRVLESTVKERPVVVCCAPAVEQLFELRDEESKVIGRLVRACFAVRKLVAPPRKVVQVDRAFGLADRNVAGDDGTLLFAMANVGHRIQGRLPSRKPIVAGPDPSPVEVVHPKSGLD